MIGQQLGRYRITKQIGVGGMGVVYGAHDDRLDRHVAIKVLPPDLLADEVVRHRFKREALALSKLNHPNIAILYDFDTQDGTDFLVMEEVAGATLDAKLATGALKQSDVIRLGLQLAEALAAAHQNGVLHRDLKPSNLRLTHDGRLKVLDFGLARTLHPVSPGTATESMTDYGSAAGTLSYMAPEQLTGEEPDFRSDIYGAGVVLFEMATGRHPFEAKSGPALIDQVLHQPPPSVRMLAPGISPELDRIIEKCLDKNPDHRYQSARELAVDLRRLEMSSAAVNVLPGARVAPRFMRYSVPAAVVVFAVLAFVLLPRARQTPVANPQSYQQVTDFQDAAVQPSFSSDGRMVTFIRGPETFITPGQVYVKFLPDGQPVQLTHDNLVKMSPVFSPDGSRIAYTVFDHFNWHTYEVPVIGGEPRLLLPNASGLTWLDRQHLLFSEIKHGAHMALVTASESRTEERDVYNPAEELGMAHRSYLSPDRKSVVVVEMRSPQWRPCRLVPFDGSSSGKPIGPDGRCTSAGWSPDGKWIYLTSDAGGSGFHLWRQRYPEGVPEQITSGPQEEEGVAVAPDGKSVITAVGNVQGTVWMHDQKGDHQISSEGYGMAPRLSADGKTLYYLLVSRGSPKYAQGLVNENRQLMRVDLTSDVTEPILPGESISEYDVSVDGKRVVYALRDKSNHEHLWIASVDRRFSPRQLTFGEDDTPMALPGGDIAFRTQENGGYFVYGVKPDGTDRHKLLPTPVIRLMSVSPDGQWVVAWVPVSGEESSSAVQAYRLSDGNVVHICGFCLPRWSANGRYLYISTEDVRSRTPSGAAVAVGNGKTYALQLKPGLMLPAFPTGGFTSEAQLLKLGAVELAYHDEDLAPGPSPAVYAFGRRSTQRNLYRIPLP